MDGSKIMNVIVTIDNNYVQHLAVMLKSLSDNLLDKKFTVKIHCLYEELSDKNLSKLDEYITSLDNLIIHFMNVSREISDILKKLPISHHVSSTAYIRLIIGELFKEYEHVVYLDPDMVILDDITAILNDIKNEYSLYAVESPQYDKKRLNFKSNEPYFNSGMMIINPKSWSKKNIFEKSIRLIKNNPGQIKWWDQDVLNILFKEEWSVAKPEWNVFSSMIDQEDSYLCYDQDQLNNAINNPSIVHYTGSSKPWSYINNHYYKNIYWHYLYKTPWKDYIPQDKTPFNILKQGIKRIIR
jgi:lipopolysaccharide biosynthesis glycosyltransferase